LQWRTAAPFTLDVADFNFALAQAEQSNRMNNTASTREALQQAVALYRGDLLPSCYDDWILPVREELRQAYLDSLGQLVRILEIQRDYPAAIHIAERMLRHDPLDEEVVRRLIRLHALNGDRAGALRVYHTCTTVLRRELDIEPSPPTREEYEKLLGAEILPSPAVPVSTTFSPLVGREKEWAQILQAWRTMMTSGIPHVVILSGEAGIGKTRLVEEMQQWTARQGIACASSRCYAAEGELAYAPVVALLRALQRTFPITSLEEVWLSEVARLLPEISTICPDLPRPPVMSEAWQRERLFEALARAVSAVKKPLLLTIDDLQWCDRDTLEWLHFMLRTDCASRLLVVGAYRPEEIGDCRPLVALLQALRLEGQLTEIELQPLDEAATENLAYRIAGVEIGKGTAQLIYRETEGNPLFVVEIVRAGLPIHEQILHANTINNLPDSTFPKIIGLPPKVQSVLERRLTQLSPQTRQLAGLAATIGREFSFELLAKASGKDEDTLVHEFDEPWRRRIIREHGLNAYDFSHDKLREVAYRGMNEARRRILHRHTAQALESLHVVELNPVSKQIAAH